MSKHTQRVRLDIVGATCAAASLVPAATPLGLAFTYQGRLQLSGSNVTDTCDFEFSLWDDASVGAQISSTITETIAVADGLSTVLLDFGGSTFDGNARWLQIDVACASGETPQPLSPQQEMTATPYALYALDGPGGAGGFWAANGGSIHNTNTGRVGIGTTDPQAMRHVEGPNNLPLILAENNWYAIR